MIHRIITSGYTDGYIVGLSGKTGNPGITVFDFNDETNELTPVSCATESENPSFLNYGPEGVTAVCEKVAVCQVEGYAWNGDMLEKAGSIDVPGTAMCHIKAWPGGRFATVSNYMTGDFAVIRLEDGFKPAELVELYKHHGVGFDSGFRQEGPHVHSTCVSPAGRYLLVADLGLDQVFIYIIDPETGKLDMAPEEVQIHTTPGSGPRHMAFSPDGKFLYLVTEMGCTLFVYSWNEEEGKATEIGTYPLLPEGFSEFNLSADIHISADGKFVYTSNRGANTIVVFERNDVTGLLTCLEQFKLDGAGPRNFALSADNALMSVGCQQSGDFLIYQIDKGIPGKLLAKAEAPQISFCGFMEA